MEYCDPEARLHCIPVSKYLANALQASSCLGGIIEFEVSRTHTSLDVPSARMIKLFNTERLPIPFLLFSLFRQSSICQWPISACSNAMSTTANDIPSSADEDVGEAMNEELRARIDRLKRLMEQELGHDLPKAISNHDLLLLAGACISAKHFEICHAIFRPHRNIGTIELVLVLVFKLVSAFAAAFRWHSIAIDIPSCTKVSFVLLLGFHWTALVRSPLPNFGNSGNILD